MKKLFSLLAVLSLGFASAAVACDTCGCKGAAHDESAAHSHDIVDTAMEADGFSTLVAAVKAAGLVETLKGEGPFTVFAPNDEAFAKIDSATLGSLLEPANKDKLTSILTFHVVPGKVMAADVKPGMVDTVNGAKAEIVVSDAGITIDGAKILSTDIECTNGVIHVIDSVMMP